MSTKSNIHRWAPLGQLVLLSGLLLAAPLALAQQEVAQDAVWEKFRPLSEGFVARRRVPDRLEKTVAERRAPQTQPRELRQSRRLGQSRQRRPNREPSTPVLATASRSTMISSAPSSLSTSSLTTASSTTSPSTTSLSTASPSSGTLSTATLGMLQLSTSGRSTAGGEPMTASAVQFPPIWLYTDTAGLHGITLSEIAAESGMDVEHLRTLATAGEMTLLNGVQNEMQPVPWHFDATGDLLLFTAEKYETFLTAGNAYLLQQTDASDSLQMATLTGPAPTSEGQATPFRETLHFEEEGDMMFFLWLNPSNPDARYWYWSYMFDSYKPQIQVALTVPNPTSTGTAQLRVALHGYTDLYEGDDHQVTVFLNDVQVGSTLSWDAVTAAEFVADFDQGLLNADGNNTLTLQGSEGGQLLTWVEIDYDRSPAAEQGELWLHDAAAGIQAVDGFSSSAILVIEEPTGDAVLRNDTFKYQNSTGWAVAFDAAPGKDYLVTELPEADLPLVDAREQTDLMSTANRADYLIIYPREFDETAAALVAHRQLSYDHVMQVSLDDIYKQFGSGREDPLAIGRFMDHVRTAWTTTPSVVMLIGKGSGDRKDSMGYGDNFMPVLMAENPWALAPSDSRLLGVEDGVEDFAIGRLSIVSNLEGIKYVQKLQAHETAILGPEPYRASVVADDPDAGGNFPEDADDLAQQLGGLGYSPVTKLYHPGGNDTSVRSSLISADTWESGFVSFSGHGSATTLGGYNENFMDVDDAVALDNSAFPVFSALTCTVGFDGYPGTRSLGSTLVLSDGGAIATLAATGLSLNTDAHVLGSYFVDNLAAGETVGDALMIAKQQTQGQIGDFMAKMYRVIGDPTVRRN
jgi:hypothetical protein